MLGSSFSEGQSGSEGSPATHTILIEESETPVQILLELLYTGSLPEDSAPADEDGASSDECLSKVFQICHRWQLASLTDIVELQLVQAATVQNMENLLEFALLYGASELRRACIDKAAGCADSMSRLRAGQFRPSVQLELQKSLGID